MRPEHVRGDDARERRDRRLEPHAVRHPVQRWRDEPDQSEDARRLRHRQGESAVLVVDGDDESCRPRHFRRAGAHEQDYVEQGHGRRRRDAVPGRRGRLGHGLAQGRCAVRQPDFLRHDGRPGRQWLRWLDHVPVPCHGRRDELELDGSARAAVSVQGRVRRDPAEFRRRRPV